MQRNTESLSTVSSSTGSGTRCGNWSEKGERVTREQYLELREQFIKTILVGTTIPESHKALFVERLLKKLDEGYRDYGDKSYHLSLDSLLKEVQDEALDIPGWCSIIYGKLVLDKAGPSNISCITNLSRTGAEVFSRIQSLRESIE